MNGEVFRGGARIELAGHVATVTEKIAGRHLCLPWATARFHGIDFDLNLYPRLWDLHWRDVRPGAHLKVTGRVDARKPLRLAIAVREVELLGERVMAPSASGEGVPPEKERTDG
jgi:hypothetical protein